jgi:hypothetical protein
MDDEPVEPDIEDIDEAIAISLDTTDNTSPPDTEAKLPLVLYDYVGIATEDTSVSDAEATDETAVLIDPPEIAPPILPPPPKERNSALEVVYKPPWLKDAGLAIDLP